LLTIFSLFEEKDGIRVSDVSVVQTGAIPIYILSHKGGSLSMQKNTLAI